MKIGFWLAVIGGGLAMAGASVAAARVGRTRPSRDAPGRRGRSGPATARRGAATASGIGFALIIVALFVRLNSTGSAWTGHFPTAFPLILTLLAAGGIALVGADVGFDHPAGIGLAAILAFFLLGEVYAPVWLNFHSRTIGFWLPVAGALIAGSASGYRVLVASARR